MRADVIVSRVEQDSWYPDNLTVLVYLEFSPGRGGGGILRVT